MTGTITPPTRPTGPTTRAIANEPPPSRISAAWRGSRLGGKLLMALTMAILVLLFIYPPLLMIMAAFRRGPIAGQGEWTAAPFIEVMTNPATWVVTFNSIVLSVAVAVIALAFGTFFAWVAVRTTTPLRRWMTPIMAAILVVPSLFYGLGWYVTLNGSGAPVNMFLQEVFGLSGSPLGSGWPTLIFVVAFHVVPVGYLFMVGPMSRMDSALDDAARMNGAGRTSSFFTVTLPLLRPTIFGVMALMTSYGMTAFELPLLFGVPASPSILVFSTKVLNTYQETVVPEGWANYAGASSIGLILVLLVVVLVIAREILLRGRRYSTISGKGFRPEPRSYGRIQWVFLAIFALVVLLAGIIPVLQMVFSAFQNVAGVFSLGFTTANFEAVLTSRRTFQVIVTSLWVAALAGFLAACVALMLSWSTQRSGRVVRALAVVISWAPIAIPGVLVGLALLTAYMPVPGLQRLIGTPFMLVIGFIVVATPIATRAVEGGVVQISGELEESGRMAGASRSMTFLTVVLPLVMPSFFAGWFIASIGIAGNLALPVLLSSPSMRTAAVTAYDLYNQGNTAEAAALFLVLMVAIVVVGALAWLLMSGVVRLLKRARAIRIERALIEEGSVVYA
ncbi:ABC transporter permease [Pseudoclavibacter endophyticus]|uniref:Iron ABC transporter permease n=1 Tax=Pseudoclavibacter endophyticus TaxID=1778590 RepID=A0A6H9WIU5_9MICO|nr:iron ABC transporter permease [Pseudoclavibacter endophyticus]KAB1649163.1 iron ABC transporter permease [Pseudoclavibacter endophyticus]GGA64937.1 ABC transporter permease [Pseudoclavibacter endophyticus]